MSKQRKIVSPIKKVSKKAAPPQPEVVEEVEYVEEQPTQQFKDFKEYLNVFEFDCILPGSGKRIRFKPMTVKALKRMLTREDENTSAEAYTEMFDELFRNSVLNENFDPHELLVFDRYVLLLEIRKKTKGEKSEVTVTCGKCKGQSVQSIDFEDIEILPVPDNIDYTIPITSDLSITMKYLTRADELVVFQIANEETKGMKQLQKETETAIWMDAAAVDEIVTPQGPQPGITIYDKKYLLENLPQPLYAEIQGWHERYKFGPELEIKLKCPHCKHELQEDVTDLNFF
jgi:hypothetical protein